MQKAWWVKLGALFAVGLTTTVWAAEKGPIRIGWLSPQTGQWAEVGKDMNNGLRMYMEEVGYKAGGRPIEVIWEDDRADPATAVTKFRKLVTHDRVAAVAGLVTSPSGLAVGAAAAEMQVPLVIDAAAADDNTQRKYSKWVLRIGWTGSQPMYPFGEYVAKKLGHKKIVSVAVDFAFGYDNVGAFQRTLEENGGQIIQKMWAPVSTVDFAPYIGSIHKDADAVFVVAVGSMPLRFLKQYREAGIKLPLIGSGTVSDEYILPAEGDEALGFISPLHYSAALTTPANTKFQEDYQKKYKKIGSYYAANSYELGMLLVQAINDLKGEVEDKEQFAKAMRSVKLKDTPRGPFYFDEYNNPVQNIYIRTVEKIKSPNDFLDAGAIKWNTVIETIPNVSQFWKWKPEEYMKNPVYSQSYPR